MYSFHNSELVHCSMFSSRECMLFDLNTSFSGDRRKNFPKFIVIYTVNVVSETEVHSFSGTPLLSP